LWHSSPYSNESAKRHGTWTKDVVPHLSAALEQAHTALTSADKLVVPDSALYLEFRRMLKALSNAARSIRGMADYLKRHPAALLKGKEGL